MKPGSEEDLLKRLDREMYERDERIAREFGGDDPPVIDIGPHPFRPSPGSDYCSRCGGGIMAEPHWAERQM